MRKFIFLLVALASTASIFSQIQRSDRMIEFLGKKYYMHKVESGQTMFSISKTYGISITKLLDVNHKKNTDLQKGEILKIPYTEPNSIVQSLKYKHYIVKKGDTLYSLSKKFKTSKEELIDLNAGIEIALIEGRRLIVPIVSAGQPRYDAEYYYHIVQNKETLSSISRRYGINLRQLKKINKDINPNKLSAGSEIKIPIKNARAEVAMVRIINRKTKGQKEVFVEQDSSENSNKPLTQIPASWVPSPYEPYNDENSSENVFLENYNIENVSGYVPEFKNTYKATLFLPLKNANYRMLNYYRGMRLAIAQNKDIPLHINVYDTEKDKHKVSKILRHQGDVDFILGPYNSNIFPTALPYANQETKLISLLSKNEDVYSNPNILQLNTTENMINYKIATYIVNEHRADNIIIFDGKKFKKYENKEKTKSEEIQDLTETLIKIQKKQHLKFAVTKENFESLVYPKTENKDKKMSKTIALVPISDYKTTAQVLNFLNGYSRQDISVVGYYKWKLLPNIAPELLFNLNTVYFTPFNYSTAEQKDFIESYKTLFNAYPDDFSFMGYEIMSKFLEGLKKHGLYFYKKPLEKIFKYRNGGYEYINLYKVKYNKDYTITVEQ